jgi:hypothetical protein
MAVAELLYQFRLAAAMLAPWEYADGKFGRENLDDFALRGKRIWWRREVVEGLDEALFSDLDHDEKEKLESEKSKFLREIGGADSAAPDRVLAARDAFLAIYGIVGAKLTHEKVVAAVRYLGELIREKYRGDWFVRFHVRFENDWSGDPAIYVWLIVDDRTMDDPSFQRQYRGVLRDVQKGLESFGGERHFVYHRVRTIGDQADLLDTDDE